MIVYTDSIEFAEKVMHRPLSWRSEQALYKHPGLELLARELFGKAPVSHTVLETHLPWKYLYIAKRAVRSQYDVLIDLGHKKTGLPDSVVCLAGEGDNFHGFKDRTWAAPSGNIYLSAFLVPGQEVEHFGVGFTILAAVSVVDVIDSVEGFKNRAAIKWVNDILIDEAKVCGVLAHTTVQGKVVTEAVVGIGLNVETTPSVDPTPFVPKVASLSDFASGVHECSCDSILETLLQVLGDNYRLLLTGRYQTLLDKYRRRSLVIGRKVTICDDTESSDPKETVGGRVVDIGDNLELFIDGIERPVTKGRLILKNENGA